MSKWKEYKEKNGVTPLDFFSGAPKADPELAEQRLNICKGCPELIKLTRQCKKCGCFMQVKSKMKLAVCPIGKW